MRFRSHISKHGLLTAAVSIICILLAGCARDDADSADAAPADAGTPYVLRLNVAAATNSSTRSAGHPLEPATAAEEYIDIFNGDYAVVIYDKGGNCIAQIDGTDATPRQQDSFYWVECRLDDDLIRNIQQSGSDDIQVLVVANWKAYDKGTSFAYPTFSNNSLATLWTDGSNYNFSHQAYGSSGNTCWTPDIAGRRLIPMFGIGTGRLSDARKELDGCLHLTCDIPMLRALAKVEVIDNIPQSNISVSSVSLSTHNTNGRYIPNIAENPNWNKNNIQVVKPSLPDNVGISTQNLTFVKITENNTDKWVAYIPEMNLTSGAVKDNMPTLNINVATTKDNSTSSSTYAMPLGEYLNGVFNNTYFDILRNHIYRYTIASVNATANITLEVLPWDKEDDERWDYTQVPGTVEAIQWSNFANEVQETAEVTLNISTAASDILTGTFTIPSPLSGTWHAQLMPIGDANPAAVVFCNADGTDIDTADGQTSHHIWNDISTEPDKSKPTPATLYIKVASTDGDAESRFRLLIMVENIGQWMDVNMTPDRSSANYWTIIRPTNDF